MHHFAHCISWTHHFMRYIDRKHYFTQCTETMNDIVEIETTIYQDVEKCIPKLKHDVSGHF